MFQLVSIKPGRTQGAAGHFWPCQYRPDAYPAGHDAAHPNQKERQSAAKLKTFDAGGSQKSAHPNGRALAFFRLKLQGGNYFINPILIQAKCTPPRFT